MDDEDTRPLSELLQSFFKNQTEEIPLVEKDQNNRDSIVRRFKEIEDNEETVESSQTVTTRSQKNKVGTSVYGPNEEHDKEDQENQEPSEDTRPFSELLQSFSKNQTEEIPPLETDQNNRDGIVQRFKEIVDNEDNIESAQNVITGSQKNKVDTSVHDPNEEHNKEDQANKEPSAETDEPIVIETDESIVIDLTQEEEDGVKEDADEFIKYMSPKQVKILQLQTPSNSNRSSTSMDLDVHSRTSRKRSSQSTTSEDSVVRKSARGRQANPAAEMDRQPSPGGSVNVDTVSLFSGPSTSQDPRLHAELNPDGGSTHIPKAKSNSMVVELRQLGRGNNFSSQDTQGHRSQLQITPPSHSILQNEEIIRNNESQPDPNSLTNEYVEEQTKSKPSHTSVSSNIAPDLESFGESALITDHFTPDTAQQTVCFDSDAPLDLSLSKQPHSQPLVGSNNRGPHQNFLNPPATLINASPNVLYPLQAPVPPNPQIVGPYNHSTSISLERPPRAFPRNNPSIDQQPPFDVIPPNLSNPTGSIQLQQSVQEAGIVQGFVLDCQRMCAFNDHLFLVDIGSHVYRNHACLHCGAILSLGRTMRLQIDDIAQYLQTRLNHNRYVLRHHSIPLEEPQYELLAIDSGVVQRPISDTYEVFADTNQHGLVSLFNFNFFRM